MVDTLLTHLQIFGIGFSFGIAGPCFLTCAPILITYSVGSSGKLSKNLFDVLLFLCGRLAAYIVLGAIAGLSASLLRQFTAPSVSSVARPIGGAVSIVLGILMLFRYRKGIGTCGRAPHRAYGLGGLFLMGFTVGIAPCAPLAALLFDIALISKNTLDGALYAFSFGAGTFLSGIVIVGAVTAGLSKIVHKTISSDTGRFIFTAVCAGLLILLGIGLIMGGLKH